MSAQAHTHKHSLVIGETTKIRIACKKNEIEMKCVNYKHEMKNIRRDRACSHVHKYTYGTAKQFFCSFPTRSISC